MQMNQVVPWKLRVSRALRWAILFSLALVLAFDGGASIEMIGLFALGGIWNLFLSLTHVIENRYTKPEAVYIFGDALLSTSLYFFSGTLLGPLAWAGLLPVVSTAIYYRLRGGLLGATATSLVFGLLALIDFSPSDIPTRMALPAGAFFLIGIGSGLIVQQRQLSTMQNNDLQKSHLDHEPRAKLSEGLKQEIDRLLLIQTQDRHQLARNLHDGPAQSVAAIAMRVNLARRLVGKDEQAVDDELQKVEELARKTTKEMRHTLFALRPLSLESDGLKAALHDLVNQAQETYDQNIHLDVDMNAVKGLNREDQRVLFYIAVEAITNARKHAKAGNIWVQLREKEKETVLLEVRDDGLGFNPSELDNKHKFHEKTGLDTLRERVELLRGKIQLESEVGRGTHLKVWVPLSETLANPIQDA